MNKEIYRNELVWDEEKMEVNRKSMDLHPMLHQLIDQFQPWCAIKNLEYHLQIPGKTSRSLPSPPTP
ncbi:MAG: hypothetical protein D4R67_10410 [Bacteroidetes bacterium]|nr:MAG: hypothetical protein D4R67_10410 [Bacteroidota bacterium]